MRIRQTRSPVPTMRLIKPLMLMLMAFYIGYHTLHGERGLYALMREKRELTRLQEEIATTRSAREKVELRVTHLRDGSLDRDLLDEQMRRMMGVMGDGEIMLLTPTEAPKS